ncbi:MAG: phosphotransferase [Deltaproteobacteria bacterium]|nr:phosphotransferase [Deltaproteobacteria bacterium]
MPLGLFRPDLMEVLAGRRLVRAWSRLVRFDLCELDTQAQIVNVRGHWHRTGRLRAFYDRFHELEKVSVKMAAGFDSVQREVKNRRLVEQVGELQLPRLHTSGSIDNTTYLVEDWINGRSAVLPRDGRLVESHVFPALIRHFQAYGIKERSLEDAMGADFASEVELATDQIRWSPNWIPRKEWVARIRELCGAGRSLPTSFCHADLNLGHIALCRNRVFLLDWGAAAEKPIATDFVDLIPRRSSAMDFIYDGALRRLSSVSSKDAYRPRDQLLIAALRRVARWRQRAALFAKERRPQRLSLLLHREIECSIDLLARPAESRAS